MAKNIEFEKVKMERPGRNRFDLSHKFLSSVNFGELIPVCCEDVIPGDIVKVGGEAVIRFMPMVFPIYTKCYATIHYFNVPWRLLWPNWENYITGTKVDGDVPGFPTLTINSGNGTRLTDYMGIPPTAGMETETISAMHFAAYQCVYNEYYRDENLINPVDFELIDGSNNASIATFNNLRRSAWEHDYFTSCLPFAQKGDPVQLPIAGFTDVEVRQNIASNTTLDGTPTDVPLEGVISPDMNPFYQGLYAATSEMNITAATINDLRTAIKTQEYLEKDARGGTRYTEWLRAHFGVAPDDARLQRPEYISGIRQSIQVSEVLNTTGTAEAPQGTFAGHGIGVIKGNYGDTLIKEFGCIIGIMRILPETAYSQGIERKFLKINDRTEFYDPAFANLGEQAVLRKELFAFNTQGSQTFGYNPRWSEHKFVNNRIAGQFRATEQFAGFTMARQFDSIPLLNEDFIQVDQQTADRVFAVPDTNSDKLMLMCYNDLSMIRPLPRFSTPSF